MRPKASIDQKIANEFGNCTWRFLRGLLRFLSAPIYSVDFEIFGYLSFREDRLNVVFPVLRLLHTKRTDEEEKSCDCR